MLTEGYDLVKDLDMHPIGKRIADRRRALWLSQTRLGALTELKQNTISALELGNRKGLALGALTAIAQELEVSLDWLVWGDAGRPPPQQRQR